MDCLICVLLYVGYFLVLLVVGVNGIGKIIMVGKLVWVLVVDG